MVTCVAILSLWRTPQLEGHPIFPTPHSKHLSRSDAFFKSPPQPRALLGLGDWGGPAEGFYVQR